MEYQPKIAMAALELCGTPWHIGGRLPGIGLDCVGILVCASKKAGIPLEDFSGYGSWPCFDIAKKQADRALDWSGTGKDPTPGDVILFRLPSKGGMSIGHFGIYVGAGRFVHVGATKPRKVVAQSLTQSWKNLIHGTYSFPRGGF